MADLWKVWTPPPAVRTVVTGAPPPALGTQPLFDWNAGDVVLDGTGQPVMADEQTTWEQELIVAVLVQKNAYRACQPDFGTDIQRARRAHPPARQQAIWEASLRPALQRNPKTAKVNSIRMSRAGNVLTAAISVTSKLGLASTLTESL